MSSLMSFHHPCFLDVTKLGLTRSHGTFQPSALSVPQEAVLCNEHLSLAWPTELAAFMACRELWVSDPCLAGL